MTRIVIALAFMLCAPPAWCDDAGAASGVTLSKDRFSAGGRVDVATPVEGDLIAAGGNVRVSAPVGGDVVLAGGEVDVDADVAHGLYAAGGHVRINGTIGRNARFAGGQVEVGSGGRVEGNVTVAGGDVDIRGPVQGYVQAAGGRVTIDAAVGGDVVVSGGHLTLGPAARIAGTLRYRGADLVRDPGAIVAGAVTREERTHGTGSRHIAGRWGGWIWTAGLMVLAAIVAGAVPALSMRVAPAIASRPALTVLVGFLALVAIPVAALLFMVTIIGLPLGFLTVLAYLALLLVGYIAAAIALGDSALNAWRSPAATRTGARVVAAALAVLLLALLSRIPYVGTVIIFAVLVVGIGAVLMCARSARATPDAAAST